MSTAKTAAAAAAALMQKAPNEKATTQKMLKFGFFKKAPWVKRIQF